MDYRPLFAALAVALFISSSPQNPRLNSIRSRECGFGSFHKTLWRGPADRPTGA